MNAAPFSSDTALATAFEEGLIRLLDDPGLGAFILVAANAGLDPDLLARLRPRLLTRYQDFAAQVRGELAAGRTPAVPEDDLMVFLKLLAIGFESLVPAERRELGPWTAQFNLLRSFRPRRISGARVDGIRAPFDERGFHFNKPFLQKECLWRGELLGRPVALFYNKFPFADYHCLLVPEPESRREQFLDEAHHHYLWRLAAGLGEGLKGVGLGYNAYGAHATVNQFHAHLFVADRPLPIQSPRWTHNGGGAAYPTDCHAFDDAGEAWRLIDGLHERGRTYNLLYAPGRCWCLPRKMQGEYQPPPWSSGFAWHELAGGMVTFNREAYAGLEAAGVAADLAALRLDS